MPLHSLNRPACVMANWQKFYFPLRFRPTNQRHHRRPGADVAWSLSVPPGFRTFFTVYSKGKVKAVPVHTMRTSLILSLCARCGWVVRFMLQPLYSRGRRSRYPLNRRLGGYRSLSGYTLKQIWNTNGTELLFLFLNIMNRKRIGQMFTYKDCTNLDTL